MKNDLLKFITFVMLVSTSNDMQSTGKNSQRSIKTVSPVLLFTHSARLPDIFPVRKTPIIAYKTNCSYSNETTCSLRLAHLLVDQSGNVKSKEEIRAIRRKIDSADANIAFIMRTLHKIEQEQALLMRQQKAIIANMQKERSISSARVLGLPRLELYGQASTYNHELYVDSLRSFLPSQPVISSRESSGRVSDISGNTELIK